MAVIYCLIANFGTDTAAADAAAAVFAEAPPIPVRPGVSVALHPPRQQTYRSGFHALKVFPIGVSMAYPRDSGHPHVDLGDAEVATVARGLYTTRATDAEARLSEATARDRRWTPYRKGRDRPVKPLPDGLSW